MAEPAPVQSPYRAARGVLGVLVTAALLLIAGRTLFEPVGTDATSREIKFSAHMPVLFWCLSWPFMLTRRRREHVAFPAVWTMGCLLLWVHIALAFHLGHGWSHQAAWEHTRQVGGYGDGIFVNYTFALVWLADVVWVWVSPASYLTRPRWLHWTIHGFLAFVVVNAAFVFADWYFRITFVFWVLFFALFMRYVQRRFPGSRTGDTNPPAKPRPIRHNGA
jgi:hypothetical protein